jgi:hypothetical protein
MVSSHDSALNQLGLYPLSNILSFLKETEGVSFLISNRRMARKILPLFHLRETRPLIPVLNSSHQKKRHRFVVAPVQDAEVRLARLNTRRWKLRKLKNRNKSTSQVAIEEWKYPSPSPPLLRFWPITRKQTTFEHGITLLASYPRSGNTLLRSLLEGVTGVVTASDTRADRTLSQALANQHDLVGEGLCQPPICKTHWPERIGCKQFEAHRAILVIRNPFDAIISYWNLNLTNTHTEKVTDQVYKDHQGFFQELVRNEMKVWLAFLTFWLTNADIPVLAVRYEDLILNPRPQLERILKFYSRKDNGRMWAERLTTVLGNQTSHGYQSSADNKSHSSIGRSIFIRYSPDLLQSMHEIDEKGWLKQFGYHVYKQGFPQNLKSLPNMADTRGENKAVSMVINQPGIHLRSSNSPYGRKMRDWRRMFTKDDTKPFPTIPRKTR